MQSIGSYAFYECSGITGELNLGECTSLTSIGNSAFDGCSGLTSVDLSGCTSLTSIGPYVFRDCSGLTNIALPSSLKAIGDKAFQYCSGNLENITVEGDTSESAYYSEENCLIERSTMTLLLGCNNSVIPNDIKAIGNYAFYGCSGLTSVDLSGCTSLTSIGDYAFRDCSRLTGELNLGECTSLTSIGWYAFRNCSGLTGTITIPASVTSIGDNPFAECGNIEGIVIEEGNGEYYIEENCLIENSTKTLITGFNNSTIQRDIKIIGDYAFYGCSGLTSISLPSSLTSIGTYAFNGCSGLTSISLPSSLTSIGGSAFRNCRNLTEVIIDSEYVYTNATSTSACGYLLRYATTVKVLTSLVSDSHAYINSTNFPNVSTEVIDGKSYTVYSK